MNTAVKSRKKSSQQKQADIIRCRGLEVVDDDGNVLISLYAFNDKQRMENVGGPVFAGLAFHDPHKGGDITGGLDNMGLNGDCEIAHPLPLGVKPNPTQDAVELIEAESVPEKQRRVIIPIAERGTGVDSGNGARQTTYAAKVEVPWELRFLGKLLHQPDACKDFAMFLGTVHQSTDFKSIEGDVLKLALWLQDAANETPVNMECTLLDAAIHNEGTPEALNWLERVYKMYCDGIADVQSIHCVAAWYGEEMLRHGKHEEARALLFKHMNECIEAMDDHLFEGLFDTYKEACLKCGDKAEAKRLAEYRKTSVETVAEIWWTWHPKEGGAA